METCVLIPQELALAVTTLAGSDEADIAVWTTTDLAQGTLFYPFQGTIRLDTLDTFKYLDDDDIRYRFGLYDEISYTFGKRIRHCNWVRFLRVASVYDATNVNVICTKVKGEPIYEVIRPVTHHQELVVFYLPERPEEMFFMRMRSSLYRQTMDSILEDTPLDLSTSLLHRVSLPISPVSNSEDEHKSVSSDCSTGSVLSLNENTSDHLLLMGSTDLTMNSRSVDAAIMGVGGPTTGTGLGRISSIPITALMLPGNNTCLKVTPGTLSSSSASSGLGMSMTSTTSPALASSTTLYQTPQRSTTRSGRGERSLLPCEVCGKAFDRPSLLKRHMRTHTGEKPHVCLVCGKGFSTSSSLNTHRRIHSGEKPHECQVCGKRFTASSNLYYHRMTHIKEKPHKCNLCAKSFPTPGDLKSHMYVHSGSWPFKCHICFRGFSKQTNLKNHLFLHTGDKPHACELCNKKFALACNLRAHMKTHEGDPQDECVRCGKVFITPTAAALNNNNNSNSSSHSASERAAVCGEVGSGGICARCCTDSNEDSSRDGTGPTGDATDGTFSTSVAVSKFSPMAGIGGSLKKRAAAAFLLRQQQHSEEEEEEDMEEDEAVLEVDDESRHHDGQRGEELVIEQ